MRYAPPGMCLNDFAVWQDGADYHLLHLQGPWTPRFDERTMETSYGRARSTDLTSWEPMGPAFGVGVPGRFDESAVWTMHPFAYGAGVAMAYTGVRARPWAEQAVGLAYTDRHDATGWRRVRHSPVVTADARWYRTGEGMAWRDPFVVEDAGAWVMVVCASASALPADSAGCVGIATSTDLLDWTVLPPLIAPGDIDELECPILERTPTGWLLLGSIGAEHRIHAWRADTLSGPWHRLGPIAPPGPYAPRIIDGPDGTRLLLHTVQRRVGLNDQGMPCRGMLAQPKVLDVDHPDGPRLRWWKDLDAMFGPLTTTPTSDGLLDIALSRPARIRVGGTRLNWDDTAITLVGGDGALQRHRWPTVPTALKILLVGEFIEVYADDVLIMAATDYTPRALPATITTAHHDRELPIRGLLTANTHPRDDVSATTPGPLPPSWPFRAVDVPA